MGIIVRSLQTHNRCQCAELVGLDAQIHVSLNQAVSCEGPYKGHSRSVALSSFRSSIVNNATVCVLLKLHCNVLLVDLNVISAFIKRPQPSFIRVSKIRCNWPCPASGGSHQ